MLDVQIYDANRNVMTQNYDIQVVPGALTVNPIPLVISSGSANKRYDGTALTEDFWQLEHGKLLDLDNDGEADHKIEAENKRRCSHIFIQKHPLNIFYLNDNLYHAFVHVFFFDSYFVQHFFYNIFIFKACAPCESAAC